MAIPEIEVLLNYLALERNVAASTQYQALSATLFCYRRVLNVELSEPLDILRAKKPKRLPTVRTRDEALAVIDMLSGQNKQCGAQ